MAETAQKTSTPRRGARSLSRTATAKPATEKPATAVTDDGEVTRITVELEKVGETKQYSKWAPPKDSGCVGSLYAPLGATAVSVEVSGPA